MIRLASIIPLLTLAACGPAPAPVGPSTAPRSADAINVKLDGIDAMLRDGVAQLNGPLLRVAITDRPIACDDLHLSDHGDPNALGFSFVLFELPRGPGGRYFDGKPVGTHVWFHGAQRSAVAAPHLGAVSIEAFDPHDGARVHGALHVEALSPESAGKSNAPEMSGFRAEGAFDVRLCPPTSDAEPPQRPARTPEGPITAMLVGLERFAPRSALAIVEHDAANDVDFVSSVQLFDAQIDCTALRTALATSDSLSLDGFGLSARTHPTGTAIPASGGFHFQRAPEKRPRPPWLADPPDALGSLGCVTFEAIGFAENATIRGSAHLAHPALTIDGHFEARVCRW